jgi:hypothetical protein
MTRVDEWADNEIILAIAACPREKQSYGPTRQNVIELANLIGRTTGAVSHRFANISHLIHGAGHGEAHVSERTRELYAQFLGKDDELRARANAIRARLTRADPTPRVEKSIRREESKQLSLDVFQEAAKVGLSEEDIEVYEREGCWIFGVLVKAGVFLADHPEAAVVFALWLIDRLGKSSHRSKGFDLAVAGRRDELADALLKKDAPMLHLSELSAEDRVTVAMTIENVGSMRTWQPGARHLKFLASMNRTAERARIREYLKIDANRICDNCLLLLRELIEKMIRKGAR